MAQYKVPYETVRQLLPNALPPDIRVLTGELAREKRVLTKSQEAEYLRSFRRMRLAGPKRAAIRAFNRQFAKKFGVDVGRLEAIAAADETRNPEKYVSEESTGLRWEPTVSGGLPGLGRR